MPAIDYFYKKLDRLGSKIGTSLRSKISKRDLLILSFISIGIFIVSVYFGGVIGAFTFVLAVATIWNAKITRDLLKQSNTAFVINMIERMTDYINRNTTELGRETVISHTIGELAAIRKVNKELSDVVWEALGAWSSNTKYKEFIDRYEQLHGKELDTGRKANNAKTKDKRVNRRRK